ncbi:hypothetical protein [Sulfitobacter sp. MF3-043]|uniref:hypothetical protein n=1 Tax=Sulfitobacter sediminivivens TaxID=3252902 RepID=UPI0036D8397F
MAGSNSDDFGGLILSLFIISGILALAAILTPALLVGIPAYAFYRLYKESPRRLERLAREETEILYNHALSGQVRLSDAEIDAALSHH